MGYVGGIDDWHSGILSKEIGSYTYPSFKKRVFNMESIYYL